MREIKSFTEEKIMAKNEEEVKIVSLALVNLTKHTQNTFKERVFLIL